MFGYDRHDPGNAGPTSTKKVIALIFLLKIPSLRSRIQDLHLGGEQFE
jgi:hypothetical protein